MSANDTPTAAELDRLAELLAEATPGPWASSVGAYGTAFVAQHGATGEAQVMLTCHDESFFDHRGAANAAAIVALVNAAPALLAAARRGAEVERAARAHVARLPEPHAHDHELLALLAALEGR